MIETILIASGIAAAGTVSFLIARASQQGRVRAWLKAARSCGLQDITPSEVSGYPSEVSGTRHGLDVKIERYSRGKHSHGTRIVVSALDAVAPLRLHIEDFGTALQKGLGKTEVALGDPTFDQRFLVEGPAALALAVLDAATRQLVWSAMGGRTVISGSGGHELKAQAELAQSKLQVDFAEGLGPKVEDHMAGALATILELADNLARPRDVPRQLAENALHDPLWAVRLANLRTLARECRTHPETTRMLRAACSDPSEEIRLTAALALGSDGADTLLQLAFAAGPDEISARAIAALGSHIPTDRALPAVSEALAAGRVETACALMEALSRDAAGAQGAEPHFIRAVEHDQPRVRIAAAHALARTGTVAAVLPLQDAAARFGGELRSVSRQAVVEIQARAVGATPGQVSLTASGEGQVSLADDAGGQVSLPDERSDG